MDLHLGDRAMVEQNGALVEKTITSMRYQSPEWVAPPRLSVWQRVVRRLTPARFRKPLPLSSPKPAQVTVGFDEDDASPDVLARHQRMCEGILASIEGLTKAGN